MRVNDRINVCECKCARVKNHGRVYWIQISLNVCLIVNMVRARLRKSLQKYFWLHRNITHFRNQRQISCTYIYVYSGYCLFMAFIFLFYRYGAKNLINVFTNFDLVRLHEHTQSCFLLLCKTLNTPPIC